MLVRVFGMRMIERVWSMRGGTPGLQHRGRVPLDKNEGGVKDKNILSVFLAPLFCQRG